MIDYLLILELRTKETTLKNKYLVNPIIISIVEGYKIRPIDIKLKHPYISKYTSDFIYRVLDKFGYSTSKKGFKLALARAKEHIKEKEIYKII